MTCEYKLVGYMNVWQCGDGIVISINKGRGVANRLRPRVLPCHDYKLLHASGLRVLPAKVFFLRDSFPCLVFFQLFIYKLCLKVVLPHDSEMRGGEGGGI